MREELDKGLLGRANRQFGVVRLGDLIAAGLDKSAISRWVATGRLTRLYRGVYALGHEALRPEGRWLAAVWACGEGSVLSHISAAAFHRLRHELVGEAIHVTTTRSAKTRPGIIVHRVGRIERADIFSPHPLLVTTAPRTLIDLADQLPWDEYRQAADKLPYLQLEKVNEAQQRAPGRRGAPLVTRLIQAA